ncbi:MAG: rhodanese-like domain-containing protein [Gammaproteobacteria bacterium]|nr:rhodanese-like domain-containing protein [Gammaproteobacteria bacterium]MCP5137921.1 rhodanese-like domain-containing protein [Gammaproteobacteria bacterium]
MFGINEIDAATLSQWADEGKDYRLIDVRTPMEVARGIIPQGEFLPLNHLPYQMENIERDKPVIFYCRTGARSGQATAFFQARGFQNVYNLRGGIMDWARNGGAVVAPEQDPMQVGFM